MAMRLALLLVPLLLVAGCLERGTEPGGGAPASGDGTTTTTLPRSTTSTPTATTPATLEQERLSTRTLAVGSSSGHHEDTRKVMRSEAEWRVFWAVHASPQLPAPEAPKVGFGNESVIAVVLKDKPNGCWGVRVGNVTYESTSRVLTVEVVTYEPSPDMMCASVVSQPHHFVAFPERPGEVKWVEVKGAGMPPEDDDG